MNLDGTIIEIIIYDTFLTTAQPLKLTSVKPTASLVSLRIDNEVDGFVETWYDQSGNGSDATQATAGSQPKIVNAGALVTGGIDFLDGTDTSLDTTNSDICNVSELLRLLINFSLIKKLRIFLIKHGFVSLINAMATANVDLITTKQWHTLLSQG